MILSEIVQDGNDKGYSMKETLDIYEKAQEKIYAKQGLKTPYDNMFLNKVAFDLTSRYLRRNNKQKNIIAKHYGVGTKEE